MFSRPEGLEFSGKGIDEFLAISLLKHHDSDQ